MDRRSFFKTCTITAAGLTLLEKSAPMAYAASAKESFAGLPLKMAVSPGWFDGSIDQQLEQIARWGFPAYEWLNPEGDLESLRKKADSLGLVPTCIVGAGAIAPGNMVKVEDHDKVVNQFKERIKIAKTIGCTRLIGLSGNQRDDISYEEQMQNVLTCLKRLAPIAEENRVVLIMEALNPLVDHKGYFLTRTDQTIELLKAVGSPNVKMLFDIYHQQITEGNVIRNITQNIQYIGHFHVADNPGRKEPGTGELNYRNIFKAIHETGYDGFVALECGKSGSTEEALRSVLACFDWA
ncbi:MAG TPA: TIM barrel protein [Candidatus Hydrogenedentes bacterium]|nr:TIM barrel protein [Candidatus Hydrogenedentota bacterium]HOL77261.1 TIM barrel protein [Candidatus Hydrogenedentota bacterium]HPO86551.1 TIM barrel protein [Candidatus Hydrogenedentota bacterium]